MMLIDLFLDHLKHERNYSAHTIIAYSNDLCQFYEFLTHNAPEGIPLDEVSHKQVRAWLVHLIENDISARSINRKVTTLKSFYKFLRQENKIDNNPLQKVDSLRHASQLPAFIEEKLLVQLLNTWESGNDYVSLRNKLILETLYCTGIRVSELVGLKPADLQSDPPSIKVTGKRNKQRIIPITNSLYKSLLAHNHISSALFKQNPAYVFLTEKGNKTYPALIYKVVKKYLSMITTSEKRSPHVLRHTFATHLLNHGADLNAIKELLGHANLSATQVYTHNTFEKLKSTYKQAHPRA